MGLDTVTRVIQGTGRFFDRIGVSLLEDLDFKFSFLDGLVFQG